MIAFDVLWIYCSGFVLILVVSSWVLIREKLGTRMNQQRYSTIVMITSVVLTTLIMILPLGIIAVASPSDFEMVIQQLASEYIYFGGLLLVYILISTVGGWQYAKLYPLNEE